MTVKQTINKQNILVFKHWTRKKYGIFKSLGKNILISGIVMTLSLSFNINCLQAQVDTSKIDMKFQMDEIVVTGQRAPVLFSELSRVITVISKNEIECAAIQDLNSLLEYVLNVDVRQRGSYSTQSDVSIRGGSFDQTLILLNGINISDPQTGHHNLNLPIDIQSIKRIEILAGPASRVFGINAFSGAINIITGNSKENNLNLKAVVGENGFLNTTASLSVKTGKLKNFASFTYSKSDGYLQNEELNNTDFKSISVFYNGKVKVLNGNTEFQLGINKKGFGANSFYTPIYPNQFEATRTKFGSVKYSYKKNNISFSSNAYYRRHHDRFELFRINPASWYSGHNHHMTDVFGSNNNVSYFSKFGKFSFGFDYRNEHILSNVLGEEMHKTIAVPGENAVFTKEYQRTNFSYYFEYSIVLEKFSLSTGIMANWNSGLNNKVNFFPGIDLSYSLNKGFILFASVNKALRMPTFTDLFYQGPTNIGNPNLKPEESLSFEGGLKYIGKGMQGHISTFTRNGTNIIDWVKYNESDKWQSRNITSVNSTGFEISFNVLIDEYFEKSPFKKIRISYSFVNLKKSSEDFISKYALDNLKHKIALNINHKIISHFNAYWGITYQDREGGFVKYEHGSFGQETDYNPFCLVDLRIYWTKLSYKIFVEASNILDTEYFDFGNIKPPGRWIRFGGEYKIKW